MEFHSTKISGCSSNFWLQLNLNFIAGQCDVQWNSRTKLQPLLYAGVKFHYGTTIVKCGEVEFNLNVFLHTLSWDNTTHGFYTCAMNSTRKISPYGRLFFLRAQPKNVDQFCLFCSSKFVYFWGDFLKKFLNIFFLKS